MKPHFHAICLIVAVTILFYWKILLVRQYSLLLGYEGTNQMYAWFEFLVSSWRQGLWPTWDPFTFSGHSFAGEMQTGAFYPFYLLFGLLPFHNGVFSPAVYNDFFALTHICAACFMYWLARELGLRTLASVIAGLCFSLGGFLAHLPDWPHLLESGIWLPVMLCALLKAVRAESPRRSCAWAVLSGLGLALSILAGGLHIVIMSALLAGSAIVFHFAISARPRRLIRAALIATIFFGMALAGGAVQLLPSTVYARQALRFGTGEARPANIRVPYASLGDSLIPQSPVGLLFAAPAGSMSTGEYVSGYLGVFPLVLAIIGVWGNWARPWVRFFAGVAVVAWLYALGSISWLNGLAYVAIPFIWMAREASRFVYLTDFAIAILAAYGVDLILRTPSADALADAEKSMRWAAGAAALAILWPPVMGKGDQNMWIALSLVLIILSWALLRYLAGSRSFYWRYFLILALILFDLSAFDWTASDINQMRAQGRDQMQRLLNCQGAVNFLKSRPQPFRVEVFADLAPNLGDMYGIETTGGAGVTIDIAYSDIRARQDLLNARYILRPASATDPGAIYQDHDWKIYERAGAFPRAWLVHKVAVDGNRASLLNRVTSSGTDLHEVALLESDPRMSLDPQRANETAVFARRGLDKIDVAVQAEGRAMLILSEPWYTGWRATVNGRPAEIWRVDGDLKGVFVPQGESHVSLTYMPVTDLWGAALTALAFLGGAFAAIKLIR